MTFDTRITALATRTGEVIKNLPGAAPNRATINNAGRMYCYSNERWVTNSDDRYGPSYYQWNENCGTGNNPTIEWEHMGDLILPGTRVKSLSIAGRVNNQQVSDIEVYGLVRTPNPATRWQTGMDNDSENTVTDLFRGSFRNGGVFTHSGNTNDLHLQRWEFDVPVTDFSMLSLYLKPTLNGTSTRYAYLTYVWELEL